MALTQVWALQGGTATTIAAAESLAFSDGTFGNAITVGSYNDGTHVRGEAGANQSSANTPKNSKYIAAGTVDIGGGTVNLDTISTANCPLKITIGESTNITVTDIKLYAYDGTTPANAPTGMTVQMAEQGDETWTQAHGSGSALAISNSTTPAEDHDFFVLISASPTSVGVKSASKARIEFTYQ